MATPPSRADANHPTDAPPADDPADRSRGRPALTRDRIVDAAIGIADAEGLDKLTMRRLAADLGYEVMSLYNHVANKGALLDAMGDRLAAAIERPEGRWREVLRANAVATYATLRQHRWGVSLWTTQFPGPARLDLLEWQLRRLAQSPLSDVHAHQAFHAINNHVVGTLMQAAVVDNMVADDDALIGFRSSLDGMRHEQLIHHVNQHLHGEIGESFELVLDLILDGIEALPHREPPEHT